MSMTISMSFFPSKGNTVKAFASMIRRLSPNAEMHQVRTYSKYQGDCQQIINLDTLMSIIESTESESLADSRDAFYVELGRYTLASGQLVALTIQFRGRGFHDGHVVRNDSSLGISIDDSGLWQLRKRIARDKAWTGLDAPEHIKLAAIEKSNRDAELLFLKGCGFTLNVNPKSWSLDYEGETYIDHGAMYYESGWLDPFRCQMVYHKNTQEFARDFERIYADYHWGITMPLLYELKKDLWQLSESEIASLNEYRGYARRCGKDYPKNYKHLSRSLEFAPEQNDLEALNFVASLTPNKVQQLTNLPASHIKDVFSLVAESELPEIRYRDFDEHGSVLLTGAYLTVWRAYRYLAELSSDYLL